MGSGQTRILSEEIKKGQEVINRNIWEIYKEIEKFDMEKYQEKHGIINKGKNKEISNEELEVKESNKIAEILYQTGSELDYLMEIMKPKKQEKQEDKKNKGISINMMNVLENIDDDEIICSDTITDSLLPILKKIIHLKLLLDIKFIL